MNATELTVHNMDRSFAQVKKALEGLSDFDSRVNEHTFSAGETLEHLTECYVAFEASCKGEEHQWGTYSAPDKSPSGLLSAYEAGHAKSLEIVNGSDDENVLKHAADYIYLHESYHIGQLCTLRLTLDPEWNFYSIYE